MLKKRIIPCLDIKNGQTVKGVNFVDLKNVGNPIALARKYSKQGADELVFLDISATIEERKTLAPLVRKIASEINIPFTVGGGIRSIKEAELLIKAGADKISINSAAIKKPKLITELANEFGRQCVVLAVDTITRDGKSQVYMNGGRVNAERDTVEWSQLAEDLGAGEILLTSMNGDGTKLGYDLDITSKVADATNIPVIASGGAGLKEHIKELFEKTKATGALAASIFHYSEIEIPELKSYLNQQNISVRI